MKGQLTFTNEGTIVEEKANAPIWVFEGSVKRFDKVVISNVRDETMAVSEAKAKNNLVFRYKKRLKLAKNAGGITLSGKLYQKQP